MRIIHLVRAKSWGGGERYALDLVRRSLENGDRVTVVTRGIPSVDERFRAVGAELCRMPLGGVADFISPWKLARLSVSFPEDEVILHVHNFKDAEIAVRAKRLIAGKCPFSKNFCSRRTSIRLVCTRHLVRPGKTGWRWRRIYAGIDRFIFVSEVAKRAFLNPGPEMDRKRIVVIPNSIILPERYRNPVVKEAPDRPLLCLAVGRVDPEKGIDVLIRAIARLPKDLCRLRIVGTGKEEYVGELQRLIAEEGIAEIVEWAGFKEDVYREIRKADICVAPSVGMESFGLNIIEFMSQGRPVIASSNGAQREILTDDHDGILVEPGNVEALAEAIQRLAEDPGLRQRLSKAAVTTFDDRFRYDRFFDKIRALYSHE